MADLESLKQKYAPVMKAFELFQPYGAKLDTVEMAGDQLHLKGEVPSQVVANRVWDAIKESDPSYADLKHEIATTGPAEQKYTIRAGDNLSKISKLFYGTPNNYPQIAKANGLENPDKIHPGQEITLPVNEQLKRAS
jgi:nucleoid-associated protein YgaU